jgi:hypothetical protein
MPTFRPMQNSFVKGEISDKMLARQDWGGWRDSAHCLENAVVMTHGGATRRAGSAFIAEAKDSTHPVRLETFRYSSDVAYGLEFSHLSLRFFRDRALLREATTEPSAFLSVSGTGTMVTLATDVDVFTSTAVDKGREIAIVSGGYVQIVSITDARTAVADVVEDLVSAGPFAPSAWSITGIPVEVVTPYTGDEVFQVDAKAQSADVLYLFHPNHAPRKLLRVTESSFSLVTASWNPPAVQESVDYPNITLTLSAATGSSVTATASADFWLAGDVGRAIKYSTGYATITSVTSGTEAVVDILDDFPSTTVPPGEWQFIGSPNGYFQISANAPNAISVVAVYDADEWGALVPSWRPTDVGKYIVAWGGTAEIIQYFDALSVNVRILTQLVDLEQTPSWFDPTVRIWKRAYPGAWSLEIAAWSDDLGWPRCGAFHQDRLAVGSSAVWLSQSGDYENFAPGSLDTAAVTVILPGQDEAIWLKSSDKVLMVGTSGAEIGIQGGSDGVLTPSAAASRVKSRYGSEWLSPLGVGPAVLFIQRGGHNLREVVGNLDLETWQAPQLSLTAEHLFRGSIAQLAALIAPDTVLLAVTSDGLLLTDTYEQTEKIATAWAHHVTLGSYRSVAVVPYPGGEEILVVAEREIAGRRVKYIEVLDGSLNTDSALILEDEDGFEEVRGLRHLEGQSVTYKADGVAYAGMVSNGVLVLGVTATYVEIGLGFATKWIPVAPNPDVSIGTLGTVQGRRTRWSELVVRWYCTEGTPTINGEPWRVPEGQTTPYTGDTRCTEQGWVRMHGKPQVLIEQATPFSATVLGVIGRLEVDDG